MAPTRNARLVFNKVAQGYPIPGETFIYDPQPTLDPATVPLKGGALVKTLVLSVDPYLRGRMQAPETKSYTDMYVVGEPMNNFGVGVVLRSESSAVRPGDHLYGYLPFQEYSVQSADDLSGPKFRVIENKEKLPWSLYVGVLGMPGKTAVYGWKEFAKAKQGETLFVTTGAGQVGSLVIQLAKRDGLKVIGSAGSDEKVQFMEDLGADVAFNYKTTDTRDVLAEHGPVDIYWDSVGGEVLDIALAAAAPKFARFVECGMISEYNAPGHPITNIQNVLTKSITMTGFIVIDLEERYAEEFYAEMPPLVARGVYKYVEDITKGLEGAGDAIVAVQKGTNKGKSVIVLAEE